MSINGTCIATSEDEFGPIYVYQTRSSRILSFDGHVEQSCMNLNNPVQLMHKYTQAMMAGLMFLPEIKSATIMGLGAGSLAKSLLQHFDELKVYAVEYRQEVINTAKRFFHLPEDERLHLAVCDAVKYMKKPAAKSDIIFSDLYNSRGMEPRQIQLSYLNNCKKALNKNGVLVLNLWHQDFESSHEVENLLSLEFGEEILSFPVEGGNTIVLAFKNKIPVLKQKELLKLGEQLQQQTDLPINRYAKLIWAQQQFKFTENI